MRGTECLLENLNQIFGQPNGIKTKQVGQGAIYYCLNMRIVLSFEFSLKSIHIYLGGSTK